MFWPFLCLLLRSLYLCALLIFNWILWSCFGLVFLLRGCLHSLYILDKDRWIDGLQIFSPKSVHWHFSLLILSFTVQKIFSLMQWHLYISAFVACAFGVIAKKILCPDQYWTPFFISRRSWHSKASFIEYTEP